MKVWLGFLAEELANRVSFDDADEGGAVGPSVAFQDTAGESGYLPFAQALVEVAKDKFQFHTAESGEPLARHQGAREDRLGRLEAAVSSMAETIKALTKSQQVHHVGTRSSPATTSSPARPQQKPRTNSLPGLDPGVVQAALAAGVDHKALEAEDAKPRCADAGLLPVVSNDGDPVTVALVKLTALVEEMQNQKAKRGSKLDQALDGVASVGAASDGGGLSSRKNAVARRALRLALKESPEEIFHVVEKLMLEDVLSTTVPPGMPAPLLSARGWLEHRSRLTNYQAAVRNAWGIAGIHDCLIQGKVQEARARASLMLVQADQISLEQSPPFHSFASHAGPEVGEQVVSRLLDPRWTEIFLHHLQDTETYVERRRKLQKGKAQAHEDPASETGPKPKSKAKAKAAADA
ncbi:unnamed protein product [Symbiodinium natans]|uniref:Uncharacterized protein n=1 Tax=Symbiodinium natans TaxID=878477 RepID=A0A812QSL4_9DINO|nr:unnamed protein product [Symbiodinium natans]